jgi:hypothetical protein
LKFKQLLLIIKNYICILYLLYPMQNENIDYITYNSNGINIKYKNNDKNNDKNNHKNNDKNNNKLFEINQKPSNYDNITEKIYSAHC